MALTFISHPSNEVYAIDPDGNGHINIEFTQTSTGTVGMVLIDLKTNVTIPVRLSKVGNNYTANLTLPKGNYKYGFTDSEVNDIMTYYTFSVGLVFVITGHSLAQPNGEQHANDNRVWIYANYTAFLEHTWKDISSYSGGSYRNPSDIYAEVVAENKPDLYDLHQVGPWSRMAQLIAVRDDIPVAIINCAMGGSSVQMWADEAMERPFTHGFGSPDPNHPTYNLYNSGIPFFHLQNVLKVFGARNGVTAVLVQHGENDMKKAPETLGKFYQEFISKAREGSGMAKLPFVLAKSAWLLNPPDITQADIDDTLAAVDVAIRITGNTYFGADFHLMPQSLRGQPNKPDDGHWNPEGAKEAGRIWAERLTPSFLAEINKSSKVNTLQNNTNKIDNSPSLAPLLKSINWVATGMVVAFMFLFLWLLKMVFQLPFLRKIASWTLVFVSVCLGGFYFGFNYFVLKKRSL